MDPRRSRALAAINAVRDERLAGYCHRVAKWTLFVFCFSVAIFLTGIWVAVQKSEFYGSILALPAAITGMLAGIVHPLALAIRDAAKRGHRPWRFSLRRLLWVITWVSLDIGAALCLIRMLAK
jgi:hypothetical protein